jgi:hypothetical protein
MSILSSIASMVTPLVIDRVASAIGINSTLARTAINLALPAVLNAFASKAASPAGATAMHNAVTSANPNLFSSLDTLLSGSNKDAFVKSGTATLNNLLGSNAVGQLAGTIGTHSGISSNVSSMLLPMVGQMALSGIAIKSKGMNAHDLSQLLAGDHSAGIAAGTRRVVEDHVTRAPVQGTTTVREVPKAAAATVAAAAPAAARPVEVPKAVETPKMAEVKKPAAPTPTHKPTTHHTPPAAASGGSGWLRWALPLLAALAALWYFVGGRGGEEKMAEKAATTTTETKPAATAETKPAATTEAKPAETAEATAVTPAPMGVVVEGLDVNKSLTDVFGGLTTTFGGVTDATTAAAALPKLTEYGLTIDKVAGVAAKFSPEQKTMVGGLISSGLPAVKAAAEKALAGTGVGPLLKPVVDGLFAKIEGLAK